MARYSTTLNVLALEPVLRNSAAIMNTVEVIPDITFTRTGVPSMALNTPKYPGAAPSYDATAWIRSDPIIHTAPEVTRAKM